MPGCRCRELLELAAALRQLAPALVAALRLPAAGYAAVAVGAVSAEDAARQAGSVMHAPDQLAGCGIAVGACIKLGAALSLPGHDIYRIAAAAEVVLQAGPAYFAAAWPVLQLTGTVADSLRQSSVISTADKHMIQLAAQCTAVANTLGSLHDLHDVVSAFASSTARPEVMLNWLRGATQAVLALPAHQAARLGEWQQTRLSEMQSQCSLLCSLSQVPACSLPVSRLPQPHCTT